MIKKLAVEKPIIQAPMAGITTPEFVAACSDAGVLGSIGAGYLNGEQTRKFIQDVKKLTNKPFSVNLFIQEEPRIDINVLQNARVALQPIYEELGIPNTQRVISGEVFEGQVQAVIDEQVKIVSFTFGIPEKETIARLKAHNILLIGTSTTVAEALAVEEAGFDAVVVQGNEAGGHRGSFTEPMELIPTHELVKQVAETVKIPVIATGGIMTSEHVQEMFNLGASMVQIGTVLLTAHECGASNVHKNAILQSEEKATTLTRAFTGKYARGLKNKFTEKLQEAVVAPYPLQHYLTLQIRQESAKQNKPEYLSLWMGENSYLAKAASVQEIVDNLLK
ncbi:2-nitropropane dioxygenase [Lysinibacillus sp. 2017]|uniref:NAD(P)H-dependent flavin oxidoreductase n=1 Tax=unclassified Lysinibacillus TaxID=2636778 RepID=UPI000D525E63|nr:MULTISPECIES: nitronate monooxygenase [unclassified Lysinibacillus]AWE07939.1 2-nitropropane dioxygenase [Lysinibacillus sp. 2017]TGN31595.1 nitronate monooxygenase [Lysinibacillus sp. S2017]